MGTSTSQPEDAILRLPVQPVVEPPHPLQVELEAKQLDLPVLRNPELLSLTIDPTHFSRSWQIIATRHRQRVGALIANQVRPTQKIMQTQSKRLEGDVSKIFSPQFLAGLTVISKKLQVRVTRQHILDQLEQAKAEAQSLKSEVGALKASVERLKVT
mmetsp:Transcript_13313/g.25024  ORF Transcript_13313/g.25024 Transcript_13313/m.25024 type:complete len:157 (+) Transcript_13313:137-607(+)